MYRIIYAFGWTLSLLPLWALYGFAELLAFLVWHLSLYRKKVVLDNIRNAFPEKSEAEVSRIGRHFYRHFADQIMESFKLFHLSEKKILKRFRYQNPEVLQNYFKAGRSVLLATAHYGNWEWLVSLPLITEHKVLIVYKPPSDMSSDFVYKRFQTRYGGISLELPKLPRTLLAYGAKKELTATFLVNDQSPVKEHIRHWNTFMNQDTPWQDGLERLAQRSGQPVVYIRVDRARRGYYDVSFHTLFDEPKNTAEHEITDSFTRELESLIRSSPELWLWTHRRWKLRHLHPKNLQS